MALGFTLTSLRHCFHSIKCTHLDLLLKSWVFSSGGIPERSKSCSGSLISSIMMPGIIKGGKTITGSAFYCGGFAELPEGPLWIKLSIYGCLTRFTFSSSEASSSSSSSTSYSSSSSLISDLCSTGMCRATLCYLLMLWDSCCTSPLITGSLLPSLIDSSWTAGAPLCCLFWFRLFLDSNLSSLLWFSSFGSSCN